MPRNAVKGRNGGFTAGSVVMRAMLMVGNGRASSNSRLAAIERAIVEDHSATGLLPNERTAVLEAIADDPAEYFVELHKVLRRDRRGGS